MSNVNAFVRENVKNIGEYVYLSPDIPEKKLNNAVSAMKCEDLLHSIIAIQDATLYEISKKSMEDLFVEIPQLETFFRKKMERAFASFQNRILANLAQSAKERYVSFISTYPNIEQAVKNYHIASYLGITTESLSRIRKEISHN